MLAPGACATPARAAGRVLGPACWPSAVGAARRRGVARLRCASATPLLDAGQPTTSVEAPAPALPRDPTPLQSEDDMQTYVDRARVEEEQLRRKREEVELQLLRMRQQEAVRRQQAIRMRLATERANVAVLAAAASAAAPAAAGADGPGGVSTSGSATPAVGSGSGDTAATAGSSTSSSSSSSSSAGVSSVPSSGSGGPPKKKLMLKKSKRMSAVAAASGLHRLASPPPSTATSAPVGSGAAAAAAAAAAKPFGASAPPYVVAPPPRPQFAGGAGDALVAPAAAAKALLSREEIIEKSKAAAEGAAGSGSDSDCALDQVVVPKPVFILSDCTGESAARTVRAALNQFENRCRTTAPAQIMIFRFVESIDRIVEIIREAAKEDALVVYTLVDPKAVKAVQTACELQRVRYVDLWTTLLDSMELHLNAVRSGVPASLAETRKPNATLSAEYFKMIEAVEYTRKMDDGAHPSEWKNADLLILGVSRCGKTPLSIYLGQRGYKVANLPLIPGCPVPKELYQIDQTRIVGLMIDPNVLSSIRRNRVTMMGVSRAQAIDYAEIQKINAELNWARNLYNENPEWPVLDVTLRGIEETAARILKLLNDRRGAAAPAWVEAYHAKAAAQAAAPGVPDVAPGLAPESAYIYGANESGYIMQGLY